MRRGSLELSLNAVVMFIVSIIILGFGIYLVNVFLDTSLEVINAPDRCRGEIDRALAQGDRFVLCPDTIPASQFSPNRAFTIEYAFFNVADLGNSDFGVFIDPDASYEIQPNTLRGISRGEAGRGAFVIRLKDTETATRNDRVTVFVCPVDANGDLECNPNNIYGTSGSPEIRRTFTVNS